MNYKPFSTIGLNNQSFSTRVNPVQKMSLEDKLMNSNYNGPLQGTLLGNNLSNFNFKQMNNGFVDLTVNENENKSASFLNKKD